MRNAILLGLSASVAVSVMAFAAIDHTVTQKGRAFSMDAITIKKGEAVTFFNDDTVPHNIMSTSAGNEFNLGSQAPGLSTPVTFKQAGDVNVICAIHPRMKMTVHVTE
jgi:plastocyanin